MEDIDGGLHPAVDGQSLDEDEDDEEASLFKISWRKEAGRRTAVSVVEYSTPSSPTTLSTSSGSNDDDDASSSRWSSCRPTSALSGTSARASVTFQTSSRVAVVVRRALPPVALVRGIFWPTSSTACRILPPDETFPFAPFPFSIDPFFLFFFF